MAALAGTILLLDQLTKYIVLRFLGRAEEVVIIDGFFKFVHWTNTGAAWSLFHGNNEMLAIISLVAFGALVIFRHHFEAHTKLGQIALGLMFGGILGNLVDRLHPERYHVIDFLYFFVYKRGGGEAGFPAFNIADMAICTGVGLLFLLSWQNGAEEMKKAKEVEAGKQSEGSGESKPSA